MSDFNWDDHPIVSGAVNDSPSSGDKFSWDDHPIVKQAEAPSLSGHEAQLAAVKRMNESGDASNHALANLLTFNYVPQIKAKVGQILSGEGIANDDKYLKRRDDEIAYEKDLADRYPGATREGNIVGVVAPMLATGGASGVAEAAGPSLMGEVATQAAKQGIIKAAAKGATTGAVLSAAANPGDTKGVVDPTQFDDRLQNAKTGALVGGTFGAIANKIPDIAEGVGKFSDNQAFKAIGAKLKDFRKSYADDSVEDTGRFALDNKLVQAGDTYSTTAEKAQALRNQTGQQLGAGYDAAAKILPKLGPEAGARVDAAGFNPVRDKDAILAQVKSDLGYSFKGKQALENVSQYLDQLAEEHGNQTLNPQVTNQIKTALDQSAINWERNPLAREPDSEAALKTLRGVLSNKVSGQVQAMGEAIGNPDAAKNLADLNTRYAMSSKIARIAADRANSEAANHAIGLTDTIASGIGAGAGAMMHGEAGMLAGAAIGGAANKVGHLYGHGVVASAANRTAQAFEAMPELTQIQQANPGLYSQVSGNTAKILAAQSPQPGELDKQSSTSAQTQLKGNDKWAADGLSVLNQHIGKDGTPLSPQIANDPRVKNLLIEASYYKPGIKQLQSVLNRIQSLKKDGD
jgi:hypothetical protein